MREIFSISFNESNLKKFNDEFVLVRDLDEEVFYESKKTYHHEEEGLEFDYKYVVQIGCVDDGMDESLRMVVALYLTPTFNSLCDEAKLELVSVWGIDSLEDEAITKYGVSAAEVAEEGYGVRFGYADYDAPDGWDSIDNDMLDNIASVYEVIDSLRGFYIDRPWNRIGTTGWDTLKHDINGEKLFKF